LIDRLAVMVVPVVVANLMILVHACPAALLVRSLKMRALPAANVALAAPSRVSLKTIAPFGPDVNDVSTPSTILSE
jgi:hypothetical protein